VVSLRALAGAKPAPREDRATPVGRIATWLRDNL
jgi:hypothetical protein